MVELNSQRWGSKGQYTAKMQIQYLKCIKTAFTYSPNFKPSPVEEFVPACNGGTQVTSHWHSHLVLTALSSAHGLCDADWITGSFCTSGV